MKDVVTPVAPEEVRSMIQTSLENAALLNYTQLSQKANIEGTMVDTSLKLLIVHLRTYLTNLKLQKEPEIN